MVRMIDRHCRGIAVHFDGAPEQAIRDRVIPERIALLGEDYRGLRPDFAVAEGDAVAAGDVLFSDRKRPGLRYVAPASGTIMEIRRGGRRSLDRLVIALGRGDEREGRVFDLPPRLTRDSLAALLLESGAWQSLRTRPFDDTPEQQTPPDALFVTAIDTRPLAPDPQVVVLLFRAWFEAGLKALRLLSDGPTYLCKAAGTSFEPVEGVTTVSFSGAHPAGLAGTHIHLLHPVSASEAVWHIGYQDVIAIGHLLETGRIWTRRIVSVAGNGIRKPQLVETVPGADLHQLCAGLRVDGPVRLLSGSPLDGRAESYLARGQLQVTAMAQPAIRSDAMQRMAAEIRSWLSMGGDAIIPNAAHERAAPAGILPIPFLRAISVGDSETACRLGALELAEEDMALLTYVDGGRTDYGALLRRTLDDLSNAR